VIPCEKMVSDDLGLVFIRGRGSAAYKIGIKHICDNFLESFCTIEMFSILLWPLMSQTQAVLLSFFIHLMHGEIF
jgi:hypothetical protein